jgi:hypothetical protein
MPIAGALLVCQVFRIVSMVLFVAYPSVSVKILRLFNCVKVEGHYWLDADMALQCFTLQYWGYALYALTMVVVFVVGLPLGIFLVLWRRRAHLHGPGSEETMHRFGFLYEAYGPTALYWEVEELIRKLLLTAVAVLLDAGSPLQVCGLSPSVPDRYCFLSSSPPPPLPPTPW